MKKFIEYEESLNLLDSLQLSSTATHKLFISDALNRVIAQDVIAQENYPKYPTSAMDGYAIRCSDQDTYECLKLIDKNPAGSIVDNPVQEGECIKTFTGALMPEGSDTLIPVENVEVDGDTVKIVSKVRQSFALRQTGESYKKGYVLIKKGSLIDFAHIGVLAGLNIAQVEVYAKPVVAIASTGSEILDLGETQTNASQIRSSNHLTCEAIAKKYGAEVLQKGVVKDDKEAISALLHSSLKHADIVVTTGGVSVGDYDFVKDIIKEELGAQVIFQGVNIKPGQHIILAQKENKFIVGLPGFAYSSTVTFLLYVLPLINKFLHRSSRLEIKEALMSQDYPKKASKTVFSACNVSYREGNYYVDFEGKKNGTSAILTNFLSAEDKKSGLLIQSHEDKSLQKGDSVNIIIL